MEFSKDGLKSLGSQHKHVPPLSLWGPALHSPKLVPGKARKEVRRAPDICYSVLSNISRKSNLRLPFYHPF
jgi:hypothetical protein